MKNRKTLDLKKDVIKPKDQKLVGGIFFNPPPLTEVNKDHDGAGNISVTKNFFSKTVAPKDEIKDEPMTKTEWFQ